MKKKEKGEKKDEEDIGSVSSSPISLIDYFYD